MSWEDDNEIHIDYEEDTITIISNSGAVRTYLISEEADLMDNVLIANENGSIEVYVTDIEKEEIEESDFDKFSKEFKDEYREKYGEEFDDWRW